MNTKKEFNWWFPITVSVVVIASWAISGILLYDMKDRGTFGDMFGFINSLFSGLAFVGLIFAILLQRTELSLQRKELELTRKELTAQNSEMKLQNRTLSKQIFENTFFQLLSLQQEIVGSMDVIEFNANNNSKGRDCMKYFYKTFKKKWTTEYSGDEELELREKINNKYLEFYEQHQSRIGHYFRSLYHIVKLIDQSEIDDKRLYTNLVRAQLSSYELTLLFYNCLSNLGYAKFKPLVEKYALLKNISYPLLIDNHGQANLYERSAFE